MAFAAAISFPDSAGGRLPVRPLALAASRPARFRSLMMDRSNSTSAQKI